MIALPKLPPPAPALRMCVTVPAKDEAEYIRATLQALHRQTDARGQRLCPELFEVILLANNCSDATAAVARRFSADYPDFRLHVVEMTLPGEWACVGMARKLMMDEAARRLPPGGIIAMTDADTRVDRQWVHATLRAFDRGARAVGGRVIVPPSERQGYRKIHLQDVTYRSLQTLLESMIDPRPADPWPRHFQHYGPSLAVGVAEYLACGGMPPVKCIEDAAFAWALERIDVEFVHDPSVRAYTSDRDSNRIDGVAFSKSLNEWTRMLDEGRQPVVFGLQHCIQLYKWKVALRRAFYERRIGGLPALPHLAEYLSMSQDELQRRVVEAPTFGALYQDIRQLLERTHAFSDAPFPEAIRDLRRFTRSAWTRRASSKRPAGSDLPAAALVGQTL
ncbi:glycosyltransferase involved in cell wall biosynthesis [Lewinella marina]|uniref:Glycosyl transferase family 2 n=1 Tax=Neolewinella marina TaxID=438751 RepID=A0A2G0CGU2_9BACT|nr:glycosyltransferase [Neolewinella marina]NJB86395.1 glycosyltransferase involved in cell wall biosynthesis [Neolewinella marina]PHK99137.1 glycosyl transferase family 2 [Neolewinella marina]